MSICNRLDLQTLARISTDYAQKSPRSLGRWFMIIFHKPHLRDATLESNCYCKSGPLSDELVQI